METIIKNLEQQIIELDKQEGQASTSIGRENIIACMLDIKNVIVTLKRH